MHTAQNIKTLSDDALLGKINALSSAENETTVELLLHLAELDQRKLYVPLGFSSLFSYCTGGVLRYSEPAANRRICCARALSRFPELAALLIRKELSLSTLACVANILSAGNYNEILGGIKGKSFRDVQELVSKYRPKTVIREEIRPVTIISKPAAPPLSREMPLFKDKAKGDSAAPAGAGGYACPAPQSLLEERYEVRFSIKKEVMKKLEEVKVLLSGKYPRGAKLEELLDEALEALLEKRSPERREKRREAKKVLKEEAPLPAARAPEKKQPSRHIPIKLRDEVWTRDGGSCGFIGKDGKRCGTRHDLEHVLPFALSGSHEPDQLSIRCRVHNAYEAVLDFGKERMSKFVREPSTSAVTRET